jgi:hypothetical protein
VVIISRVAQIGHLCVQGAPMSVGGEMVYAEVVADRRAIRVLASACRVAVSSGTAGVCHEPQMVASMRRKFMPMVPAAS